MTDHAEIYAKLHSTRWEPVEAARKARTMQARVAELEETNAFNFEAAQSECGKRLLEQDRITTIIRDHASRYSVGSQGRVALMCCLLEILGE